MKRMKRLTSDELRKEVWDALFRFKGNRALAAEALGKSERTLNRYIHDLNLYPDLDRHGLIRNPGPPRGSQHGTSLREKFILEHIRKHNGELDYGELAIEMYSVDNDKTRQRVYSALNDLKAKGKIANDGIRWFII